ncbi:hypothetical protein [Paraburkholderia tuberum]|uniref:Uncharacterized protein n=1 Tax=Paraburkholderia tuberum TaxID=157910 RepID=A0A1H1JCA8_9BURK|nr:hypothetical protein [Paraburkholderia tuberum]SDR47276.1 hypothetical protein SAMN05445850_4530 [Paraburkholderia tuberum]
MALTAGEQKEVRALILAMIDRGCVESQVEKAWRLAVDQLEKLKAATAKQAAVAK